MSLCAPHQSPTPRPTSNASTASSSRSSATRSSRRTRTSRLDQRAFFDYGGYVTFGYLSVDDNVNENHVLRQYELVGYARVNFDGAHEFFLRGRVGYRDFNDGDTFDGRGDERIDPELDRGYYRFDLQRHQAAYHGQADRLQPRRPGRPRPRQLGQRPGAQRRRPRRQRVVLLRRERARDPRRRHADAHGRLRRLPPGLRPQHPPRLLRRHAQPRRSARTGRSSTGWSSSDYNDDDTLDRPARSSPSSSTTATTSASARPARSATGCSTASKPSTRAARTCPTASISGGGPFITPIPQTEDDISAWALDARLDYLFPDERHRTRLSGEVILATGDDDRGNTSNTFGGNAPGTNDNAFNAFGLLNTGLAFAPAGVEPDRVPRRRLDVPAARHRARSAACRSAPTSSSSTSSTPTPRSTSRPATSATSAGSRTSYLNWQVTSDVTLVFRYGIFFPNEDAFGDDDARQYIYAGVTYAF